MELTPAVNIARPSRALQQATDQTCCWTIGGHVTCYHNQLFMS